MQRALLLFMSMNQDLFNNHRLLMATPASVKAVMINRHGRPMANAPMRLALYLVTVTLFDHTIDALIFTTRLTQELLPKWPKASIIVMDNAAFHKTPAVKTTIEAAGHVIQYLPVYSPHLNPIEKKWAQAKAIRRAYRCEIDELFSHHLI
jgi:transposase